MNSEWQKVRLGWMAQTIVPQRDKPSDLSGPIPWVRIEDFQGKYISASKSGQGVTHEQVAAMPLRIFPPRTVFASCSCSMGATAIAVSALVTNQTFIGILPDEDRLSSDFLFYVLQDMAEELQSRATGAIQVYLSQAEFRQLRIQLPELVEQRNIAEFLDHETGEIDAFIADQERLIELLVERHEASISAAVTTVESDWREGRLKQSVLEARNGLWGADPDERPDLTAVRCIRAADFDRWSRSVLDGKVVERGYAARELSGKLLQPGDLVLEKSGGGDAAPVGCVIRYSGRDPIMYSNFVARIVPAAGYDGRFLTYLHRHLYASGAVKRSTKQTTGIQNLDQAAYLNERVHYPPLKLQMRIAEQLDARSRVTDEAIADAKEAIALSKERRAALISAAVTGNIDVRDWKPPTTVA
ncbi:restriction endonuclease subunit S [Luteipulveratus sp. YIM 133132]|uniref:restriction endonuclease subunit S n=1 Tax=Luteipulveratus flavus TaxID=3031728 RepID=UPI0023AF5081|nr:restriction endonuclease subunit S [Luteipulveratus sp. YIM 133132]MDE9367243.1 restriction endonuclease subunit S [Luteipulveratus sp. YIM 133132]